MPKALEKTQATKQDIYDIKQILHEFKKEFKSIRMEMKEESKSIRKELKEEICNLKNYVDNRFSEFTVSAMEIFPTKNEFNELKEQVENMNETLHSHNTSIDNLAFQVENLRSESAAHIEAYNRLEAKVKELQN